MTAVGEDLLATVRGLFPILRERAAECERARSVPRENIALLRDAGVFRILQPKRFGGLEGDLELFFEVTAAIGAACPSTGWVAAIRGTGQWLISNFPDPAQHDVWDASPPGLLSATESPGSATARPVDGGFRVDGRWRFASGSGTSDWHLVGATITAGADEGEKAFFLFPNAAVTFHDTWYVGGLAGTGSNDAEIRDGFVPAHRVLMLRDMLTISSPGSRLNDAPLYRVPMFSLIALGVMSPIVGAARAAVAEFVASARERTRSAGIMGVASRVADSPLLQQRVAEAAGLVDAAHALVLRDLALTQAAVRAGGVDVDQRIRNRRDYALAVRLCRQAMGLVYDGSGTELLFLPNPLERAWRDVNAASKHGGLNWDHIGTMVGRHMFGLDPRGQF